MKGEAVTAAMRVRAGLRKVWLGAVKHPAVLIVLLLVLLMRRQSNQASGQN